MSDNDQGGLDASGWIAYRRRLAADRAREARRAARGRPCPWCGAMCRDAPHFRAGYTPAKRRRAPACSARVA